MAFCVGSNGFIGSHLKGIDAPGLICMAGISDTTCEDWSTLHQVNVTMPAQLSSDAFRHNLPFIYASSASVYGNGDGPLNPYAESKDRLDRFMLEKAPEGVRWYGLRFHNVYGPGEAHKGKQASLVWRLAKGELTEVFEPQAKRDFIHVSDVRHVVEWLLTALPPSGIYDVGTGVPRSIHEAMELTGAKCALVPMPDSLKGKYQFSTRANLEKLRKAGYSKPFLTLEEGIALMGSDRSRAASDDRA